MLSKYHLDIVVMSYSTFISMKSVFVVPYSGFQVEKNKAKKNNPYQ